MTDTDAAERLTSALRDRYRIERELGTGGMATVYLAEDLRYPRKVAMKVLRQDLSASLGAARFLQEIEIAARLQHPHILPLLDSGEANGSLFYVMPFVEGLSLRERLERDGPLRAGEVVRILAAVVDALAYAHSRGVIHRDIKPDNIMLSGRHALVADFGVAKALSEATNRAAITTVGIALGTPAYMSPEQACADPNVDLRADIYAVGAMAYEMLAGRPPFVSTQLQKVLAAHIAEKPEPLSMHAPAVPMQLDRVVMRCLEKLPSDRYQTAEELLEQLELVRTTTDSAAPARTQLIWKLRSRRGVLGTSAAVLVGLGALYVTYARNAPAAIVIGNTTQVTIDPGLEIEPALSPNGQEVAYAAGSLGYVHIVVRRVDGGRANPLTTDTTTNEWAPRWSHDGLRILFLNSRGVFSAPAFGGPARQEVTSSPVSPVLWAAWSHDDRQIGFVRGDSLLVRSGGGDRLVAASGDLHSCDWSPDDSWFACVEGNSVSVTAGRLLGNVAPSRIVLIPTQGGKRWTLPDSSGSELSPVWHPDGRRLFFISSRHGKWDVYLQPIASNGSAKGAPDRLTTGLSAQSITLSADASRLVYSAYEARANAWALPIPVAGPVSISSAVRLTAGNQFIEAVSVSPSGRWLTYDSNLRGPPNLYRAPVGGGEPEPLTADSTRNFRGELSPNDKEFAFMSFRTGSRDIFVKPLDGGPVQQVTSTPGQERFPIWSPDGSALAFFTSPPQEVFIVNRDASDKWGVPVKRADGTLVHWSPDGQSICYQFDSLGGIGVVGAFAGAPRIVYRPAAGSEDPVAESPLFSRDGRTLFFKSHDARGMASIWSIRVAGGRPLLLVRFDDPARQSNWPELSTDGKRFYFTIDESQSDLYVVALAERSSASMQR